MRKLLVSAIIICSIGWTWGGSWDPGKIPAADISIDTTNLDGNLSSADDTVQKAIETIDEMSGAAHDAVTLSAGLDTILSLSTQELGLDTQTANTVLAGPSSGANAVPTFRQVVGADVNWLSVQDMIGDTAINWTDVEEIGQSNINWTTVYQTKCFGWFSPVDADDDIEVWTFKYASTVTNISCRVSGGTSVAVVGGDGTNSFESITCDADGATDDGSITNATFTAGEVLELDLGAPSGTVPSFIYCIDFTETR